MKWRINFSIPNTNYNLVSYAPPDFIANVPRKNGEQLFKEWYLEHENGRITAYIPIKIIEAVVEWLRDKVITEPEWADELHKKTEELNWEYFNYAKSLVKLNFKNLTNNELADLYDKLKKIQKSSHAHAVATTWFLDSDQEVYSNYLRKELEKHLLSQGISEPVKVIEYFVILTTPTKDNFAQQEEVEFLELLKKVEASELGVDDPIVFEYYKKWHWTPYGYTGPAYALSYYQDKLKENLHKIDIDKVLAEENRRNQNMQTEQEKLIKEINLSDNLQHLFKIARDIIWLKDFRKYCIWHGHYVLDMLTKEIAQRLQISHRQANYFFTAEVAEALATGKVDHDLLNQRIAYSVIWSDENGYQVYYGVEAHQIIDNLDVEQVEVDLSSGFKGTCAYPGLVRGKVKIVNSVQEIDKVDSGDIMLSLTTYPALLSAMKKAGAIVTEDGGITCHAAIVARELKIPCVVGAKKITLILKDGDLVEVDATSGLIKKV